MGGGGGGGGGAGLALKNACTTREPVTFTAQMDDVPHGALQCENSASESGVADRVTFSPVRARSVHLGLQLMPDGVDVTLPCPLMTTFSAGRAVLPAAAPTSASAATGTAMRA